MEQVDEKGDSARGDNNEETGADKDTVIISEGKFNKRVMIISEYSVINKSWKKIYKVIDEEYLRNKVFLSDFLDKCKNIQMHHS